MTDIEYLNRRKYLKAPTIKEIDSFRIKLGVSDFQFERFYEIPKGTLKGVRNGGRNLPVRFWHIIYQHVVPGYGNIFTKLGVTIEGTIQIPKNKRLKNDGRANIL